MDPATLVQERVPPPQTWYSKVTELSVPNEGENLGQLTGAAGRFTAPVHEAGQTVSSVRRWM
jgi:hypothetical protein